MIEDVTLCEFTNLKQNCQIVQRVYVEDVCNTAGKEPKLPGQACGTGLTTEAADALGLNVGLPVAVSSLDAHAGAIGNSDFIIIQILLSVFLCDC